MKNLKCCTLYIMTQCFQTSCWTFHVHFVLHDTITWSIIILTCCHSCHEVLHPMMSSIWMMDNHHLYIAKMIWFSMSWLQWIQCICHKGGPEYDVVLCIFGKNIVCQFVTFFNRICNDDCVKGLLYMHVCVKVPGKLLHV